MTSGVYAIVNTVTEEAYIGSSVNVQKRWSTHRRDLRKGSHHNIRLQRAWNKYGGDMFDLFVMQITTAASLERAERYWLEANWSSYNIAEVGRTPSPKGRRHSAETRALMSERRSGISGTGLKLTPEKAGAIKALRPDGWPNRFRRSGRWVRTPAHDVAAAYGVHRGTVTGIWSGKIWRNA